MSLVKWNPESTRFPSLSSWIDDLFVDNGDWPKPMVKGITIPAVNVLENKKEYNLEVAAPGFKKDDFKLEVENGYLVLKGETKSEVEKTEDSYTRREFRFNSFSRSFALPDNIKEADIKARYEDGILKIMIPKAKEEKAEVKKLIAVQ